eukprot:scaffold75369_cov22-Tisochrysis_lutea.AAC.6
MENLSPYPAHTCTRAHALLRLCAQGKAVADAEGSSYVGGGGSRGEESELKATMDAQLSKSQQASFRHAHHGKAPGSATCKWHIDALDARLLLGIQLQTSTQEVHVRGDVVVCGCDVCLCAPNAAPLMPIVTRCSPDAHRMVARAVQRPWFVWWAVPAACLRDRGFVGHAMKRP